MNTMISFIVPAYNSGSTIEACLRSIAAQSVKKEIILAMDSRSSDATEAIGRKYRANIVRVKRKGASAARNDGLNRAKGDWIAFVDSDAILCDGWAQKALHRLQKDRSVAGVGGPAGSVDHDDVSRSLDALLYGMPAGASEQPVNSLATMNVMYRKSDLAGIRFDESLATAEDPDLNFRIRENGKRLLFCPELNVLHHHRTDLGQLLKRWYQYGINYPKPYFRHPNMRDALFWMRMGFTITFPIFIVLGAIRPLFGAIAGGELLGLFAFYLVKGIRLKGPLLFAPIHTLKQLAHCTGILVGLLGGR